MRSRGQPCQSVSVATLAFYFFTPGHGSSIWLKCLRTTISCYLMPCFLAVAHYVEQHVPSQFSTPFQACMDAFLPWHHHHLPFRRLMVRSLVHVVALLCALWVGQKAEQPLLKLISSVTCMVSLDTAGERTKKNAYS